MFRRRRRDGGDSSGLAPGDVDYPAADDELTEQDYGDAGTDAADDYADEQYDDDDQDIHRRDPINSEPHAPAEKSTANGVRSRCESVAPFDLPLGVFPRPLVSRLKVTSGYICRRVKLRGSGKPGAGAPG